MAKYNDRSYFAKGITLGTIKETSVAYTALRTDGVVLATGGAGGIAVTLPALADAYDAATQSGQVLLVKKVDAGAGAVTVDGSGAETIDGGANVPLANQYDTALLVAGPNEWSLAAPTV